MVYVDSLRINTKKKKSLFKHRKFCHMSADTRWELVSFAKTIKLSIDWIQEKEGFVPHFDLTPTKRAKAISNGAKELSNRDFVLFTRIDKNMLPITIDFIRKNNIVAHVDDGGGLQLSVFSRLPRTSMYFPVAPRIFRIPCPSISSTIYIRQVAQVSEERYFNLNSTKWP